MHRAAESLVASIRHYREAFPGDRESLAPLLSCVANEPDPRRLTDRSRRPGHVTASGIVLVDGRVLVIRHPHLGLELPPGGHVEADETPLEAALREVEEETGLVAMPHAWHASNAHPIDIDVHGIPARAEKGEPAHLHYDFRYLLVPAGRAPRTSAGAGWTDPRALRASGFERILLRIENLVRVL